MKYQFIDNHHFVFPVVKMCRTLKVYKSGYYYWLENREKKEDKEKKIVCKIKSIFEGSKRTYGRPRLTRTLNMGGFEANEKRVHRLMKKHHIFAKTKKKFRVCTTDSKHRFPISPNLVEQDFRASKPNELWLSDITYISTIVGWVYLAAIIDVFTRKIVGWSMSKTQNTKLVKTALENAMKRQAPKSSLILHSDRGSQYASYGYRDLCLTHGIVQSMSRSGNCYDNAMMESFFHTLKTEEVHWSSYQSREEAKGKVFEYIEIYYNRQRIHSGIDYQVPVDFETAYYNS